MRTSFHTDIWPRLINHVSPCFSLSHQIWPSGPPQVQLSISRMAFLSQCSKELQKAQFGWLGGQVKGHLIYEHI